MGNIGRIIDGTVDENVRLATLLRRLLIVGEELGNDRLKAWVLGELNGYSTADDLPPYRKLNIQAKGILRSIVGQLNDHPLPASVLKEPHRWWATRSNLMAAVASYEGSVAANSTGSLIIEWPADMVVYYQEKFSHDWVLFRAWQEIPIAAVRGMLDTVRTRILQFALELKREIGDEEVANGNAPPEVVNHAVQTIIYGGTNIISSTIAGGVQFIAEQVVVEGDLFSLADALESVGVEKPQIEELKTAIAADADAGAPKGFGNRVQGWLATAGAYVGQEGSKAAIDVAKAAATKAVMAYFGMPNS